MKWDVEILNKNCNHLQAKVLFFSVCEEWIDSSSCEELFLKNTFINIKNKNLKKYYHAIFHVLSCPFCLEKSEIFQKRSHPELWKIMFSNPSFNFHELIKNAKQAQRQENEPLYYLGVLHEKLVEQSFFSFAKTSLPAAAGSNETLTSIPRELLSGFGFPSDMEIISELYTEGFEVRIQCSIPIKLTMVFLKSTKILFQLNISHRIPKKLIPPESINGWDEIRLLRIES